MGDRVITGKQAYTNDKPKDSEKDKAAAKKKKRSQSDAEVEFGMPAKSRKRAGVSVLDLEQVGRGCLRRGLYFQMCVFLRLLSVICRCVGVV